MCRASVGLFCALGKATCASPSNYRNKEKQKLKIANKLTDEMRWGGREIQKERKLLLLPPTPSIAWVNLRTAMEMEKASGSGDHPHKHRAGSLFHRDCLSLWERMPLKQDLWKVRQGSSAGRQVKVSHFEAVSLMGVTDIGHLLKIVRQLFLHLSGTWEIAPPPRIYLILGS